MPVPPGLALAAACVHALSQRADVPADPGAASQQLRDCARGFRGLVFVRNPVSATLLAQVLAQQLAGARIEHAHGSAVPLHLDAAGDPARRHAVVGSIHFDATVEVHAALPKLVMTERLQRQLRQCGLLFDEHRGNLPLHRAVNARIGPVRFPAVQIRMRFFQALEALAFERSVLGVADSALDLALAIRIAGRHGKATAP